MKLKNSFGNKLEQFREKYTLGNMFDGTLDFIDTVNVNKLLTEDYSIALVLMYEAIDQNRVLSDKLVRVINKNIEHESKINVYLITDWLRTTLTLGKPIHDVFMQCASLIGYMFPDIKPCIGFNLHNTHHKHTVYEHMLYVVDNCDSNKFEVKLAALFHDVGKPTVFYTDDAGVGKTVGHPRESAEIIKKAFDFYIKLSKKEIDYIYELILIHDRFIVPTDRGIRKILSQYDIGFMDDYCSLKKADMADHTSNDGIWKNFSIDEFKHRIHEIYENNKNFGTKDLRLTKQDIINEVGTVPDKVMDSILLNLVKAVLSGQVKNNYDDLIKNIDTLHNKTKIRR